MPKHGATDHLFYSAYGFKVDAAPGCRDDQKSQHESEAVMTRPWINVRKWMDVVNVQKQLEISCILHDV